MVSLGTSGYLSKYDSKISVSDSVVVALLNIRCPLDHKFFVYCFSAGGLRSLLFQHVVGDLRRRFAHLLEFFIPLIINLQIFADRHIVFSRNLSGLSQKDTITTE